MVQRPTLSLESSKQGNRAIRAKVGIQAYGSFLLVGSKWAHTEGFQEPFGAIDPESKAQRTNCLSKGLKK